MSTPDPTPPQEQPAASDTAPAPPPSGTEDRVLTVHTTAGARRFLLPHAMSKITAENLESWGLDYAGFCTTDRRGKSPFGPSDERDCVPPHVRIGGAVLCHRFGLDPWLRHIGPVGRGAQQRPRITRDGLLHLAHRGTPENGYKSMLDGITWEPDQPRLNPNVGKSEAGGQWEWAVAVWIKGMRHPVMGRGTAQVNEYRAEWVDGKKQPKSWLFNPHGEAMAYKQAVYSALLHATDLGAFALPPDTMKLLEQAVHAEIGDGTEGLVQRDGKLVDPSTGEVFAEAASVPASPEDDDERAALAEEAAHGADPVDDLPF